MHARLLEQASNSSHERVTRACYSGMRPADANAAVPSPITPSHAPAPQVKAWAYYEARLLGAQHGLVSTYALDTLVLAAFNRHHAVKPFTSPLQVLHKCLADYGAFDWDSQCLTLEGAVPLAGLPGCWAGGCARRKGRQEGCVGAAVARLQAQRPFAACLGLCCARGSTRQEGM